MQNFPRGKTVLAAFVSSLILFALMLLVTTNTITNVSGVMTEEVSVWWDSSCTVPVLKIDWKTLAPGETCAYIVYIRNENNKPMYLVMSTANWIPSEAPYHMTFGWDYKGRLINPGENLRTTVTLSVSRYIIGISSFSFTILVGGSDSLPGDIDGDGNISILDLKRVKLALAGLIAEPEADLDGDGLVTILDLKKLQRIYDSFYG